MQLGGLADKQTMTSEPQESTTGSKHESADSSRSRKKQKREYHGRMLNRWPRAFARLFDLLWQIPLVSIALLSLASKSELGEISIGSVGFVFLLLLSLPLALFLDGLFAGIFGNTPAKALIGVKATTSRGDRLPIHTHLRRSFGVWTDGLAIGLVPISLISMFRQFKRVSGRREAIYDERLHVRVRSGRMTGVRVVLLVFLIVGALAAFVLLGNNGIGS